MLRAAHLFGSCRRRRQGNRVGELGSSPVLEGLKGGGTVTVPGQDPLCVVSHD